MEQLDTVRGSILLWNNPQLHNFQGLNNLGYIARNLIIINNSSLEDLEGLNNLNYIGEDLIILENPVLTNLDGLEQLDTIKKRAYITDNPLMSSIQGLAGLDYLHELEFFGNHNIISLTGLEQVFIDSVIYISDNMGLTSLDGLGSLDDFNGSLILDFNRKIADFSVLSDLDSVYSIQLSGCDSLTTLQVLDNLVFVEDWLVISTNSGLISLEGMSNLNYVGSLGIGSNTLLTNLAGLPELKEIKGDVTIIGNGLQSLEGLDSLFSVGRNFYVYHEDSLLNLRGLDKLNSIGDKLWLYNNDQLQNLSGLGQLTSVGSTLEIDYNDGLLNLAGLDGLSSVGSWLQIENNGALLDLTGLESLDSIGAWLWIRNNPSLSSLNGLENLQYVGEVLSIENNISLTDINALNHSITPLYHDIDIRENVLLSECAVQAVCEALQTPWSSVWISNNNEGCQNNPQVMQACLTNTLPGLETPPECVLFPNPFHHSLQVFVNVPYQDVTLRIRDISGRVWMQDTFFRNQQYDLSFLSAGIYFVEIEVLGHKTVRKIVKI